jgi:3-oxoacid CoA-transferase A subunit
MKSKVLSSFDEAVADIPDGSVILLAGFGSVGMAFNLIAALYRQGAKDLTLVGNALALPEREGLTTAGSLMEGKRVRKVIAAFTAATHPSRRTPAEVLMESGEVESELVPQGTLAERIRAGGAGIPAFYTRTAVGTELAEGKEHRVFNGQTYLMEEAITADYAFCRAWKADEFGNLVFKHSQRNFNPLMATAARCTIVEAEDVVPVGSLDPDLVHTPGIFVHRIVKMPPDAVWHVNRIEPAPPQAD